MARARTIKPSFFKNETLAELPLSARLLFIGLWTLADRAGRLEDRPRRIKAEIFPYEDYDVESGLSDLCSGEFIVRYQVDESAYIQIVTFDKHQSPHVKEPASTIPAPYKYGASTSAAAPLTLNLNPITLNYNPEPGATTGQSPEPPSEKKPNEPLKTEKQKKAPPNSAAPPSEKQEADPRVVEVVNHLNELCQTEYQPKAKQTKTFILARITAGFSVDDFKLVIAHKAREWLGDPKMRSYLRPETLFCEKHFEGYVNAAKIALRNPQTQNTQPQQNGKFTFDANAAMERGIQLAEKMRWERENGIPN